MRVGEVEALALDGESTSVVLGSTSVADKLPREQLTAEVWVRTDRPEGFGGMIGVVRESDDIGEGWLLGYLGQRFRFALGTEDGGES